MDTAGRPERPAERDELLLVHDQLREAMVVFFRRNRVPDPEDLANEVFLRLLQKLRDGLTIERSVGQFCWRVARFVLMEQYRRRRFTELAENTPAPEHSVLGLQDIETGVLLDECMEALSARDFDFVKRYLHENKESLARELKTNPAAMAIRFCKLKKRLEKWVRGEHTDREITK
jgi:DNA-directed RNA polymerase specialized sigma24 family protein